LAQDDAKPIVSYIRNFPHFYIQKLRLMQEIPERPNSPEIARLQLGDHNGEIYASRTHRPNHNDINCFHGCGLLSSVLECEIKLSACGCLFLRNNGL
jgi:hypothetical protein